MNAGRVGPDEKTRRMAAIDNFVAAKSSTQQVNIAQQGSIALLFCIFYGVYAAHAIWIQEFTEDRLSRNLKAVELEAELTPQLAAMASHRVSANTVLCLDLSDIRKEYAKKMEYLAPGARR